VTQLADKFRSGLAVAAAAIVLALSGCSSAQKGSSLKNFVQDGQKSLAEVTDSNGYPWKILTVETAAGTTIFVYNATGQRDVAAVAYKDSNGVPNAYVLVDPGAKEGVLAVLDKKFLSALNGRSEAFDAWVKKSVGLTYGGASITTRMETKAGELGSGQVQVIGGKITVDERSNPQPLPCYCQDGGGGCGNSVQHKCVTALCDLMNCVNQAVHTGVGTCGGEATNVRETCALLAN